MPLGLGLLALVGGTAAGWSPRVVALLVAPPATVRVALVAAALLVAFVLFGAAVGRLRRGSDPAGPADAIRGVRLAFLAVAALAAAAGWALASPVPIVLALVIGGVDVLETSFLLLVVAVRR